MSLWLLLSIFAQCCAYVIAFRCNQFSKKMSHFSRLTSRSDWNVDSGSSCIVTVWDVYINRTPIPLFKVSCESSPCGNLQSVLCDAEPNGNDNVITTTYLGSSEDSLFKGSIVRASRSSLCNKLPLWTLPAGSLLPEGLAVAWAEIESGFYPKRRNHHYIVPNNITELKLHCFRNWDRLIVAPTVPMTVSEYESKLRSLPWVRAVGCTGLGPLVSEQAHMKFDGSGVEKFVLRALRDFILMHESNLSSDPEYWEHIVYAGALRTKIMTLCEFRDSNEFAMLPVRFPFCQHALQMLTEVLGQWSKHGVSGVDERRQNDYITGLKTVIAERNIPVTFK